MADVRKEVNAPHRAPPESERAPMVGWFDPGQLLRTAVEVVVSTAFGRNADARLIEAALPDANDTPVCDYTGAGDEMWLDYISDTGDGWNSTYHVAYTAAQPQLAVEGQSGTLPRGQVLVLGGDQVYPTPSRELYEKKLHAPFASALPPEPFTDADGIDLRDRPGVFAIPGNHDWYDSLVSFRRLFCTARALGGWRTKQARSYFAAQLPHDWWLIGIDVQLESDMDAPQIEYFRRIAEKMSDSAKLIVCLAEPHWIFKARYAGFDPKKYNEGLLDFLERHVFDRPVSIWLAGDIHHYRRHEQPATGTQKITCGSGGAYMDGTHADEKQTATIESSDGRPAFERRASFPDVKESRARARRDLFFPLENPSFGIATGILYLLTAWSVKVDLARYDVRQFGRFLEASVEAIIQSQTAVAYGLVILLGFYFYTDTHSTRYRAIAGPLHGFTHLSAAFLISWVGILGSGLTAADHGYALLWRTIVAAVIVFAGGYLAGSTILGLYLFISCQIFGRHGDHAFSALRTQDWKAFLRMHVTASGVTIYPIGIRTVARKWRDATPSASAPSLLTPDDPKATNPHLIEGPIRVAGRAERLRGILWTSDGRPRVRVPDGSGPALASRFPVPAPRTQT